MIEHFGTLQVERDIRSNRDCKKQFGRCVAVADNDNDGRASPVHHRYGIWRHLAESHDDAKPHG